MMGVEMPRSILCNRYDDFRWWLRRKIKERGLLQKDIAETLNIERCTVSQKLTKRTLFTIEEAFVLLEKYATDEEILRIIRGGWRYR